jgi:hypothetical protein
MSGSAIFATYLKVRESAHRHGGPKLMGTARRSAVGHFGGVIFFIIVIALLLLVSGRLMRSFRRTKRMMGDPSYWESYFREETRLPEPPDPRQLSVPEPLEKKDRGSA